VIEIYFKSIRDVELKKTDQLKAGSWINIDSASIEDLNKISEITGIETNDLKDSLDKHEIPRIGLIDKNILIFIRYPLDEEPGMHTATLAIILTPSYLITISPQKNAFVNSIVHSKLKIATTQKSKLLFHILLKITQDFTTRIKKVMNTVIEQGQKIRNINNEAIMVLTKNEEIVNQYLSSLVPIRNVLETITSGRYVSLYEKDYDLLQDLLIAIKQSEDLCRVNIKNIRSLRDSYQILFTNDVNKTIKLLTAITIIFTIPTIIASIYGMNVSLPFATNPYAFLIIINITILISIICLVLFIRKRWI
jgi:magnesium transporter